MSQIDFTDVSDVSDNEVKEELAICLEMAHELKTDVVNVILMRATLEINRIKELLCEKNLLLGSIKPEVDEISRSLQRCASAISD